MSVSKKSEWSRAEECKHLRYEVQISRDTSRKVARREREQLFALQEMSERG